ncbi:MAG TPA: hypothetical protein VFW11_14950 [Cyclobacteriaceae bacterium]|nr:hypothetical protein [Cyclobacteriaceae bacterium]
MEVIPGKNYRLDGNLVVTVIKPINRAKTSFSVEVPGKGIYSVGKERLTEHTNKIDNALM